MTQVLVVLQNPLPQTQFSITTSSNPFIIVTYCLFVFEYLSIATLSFCCLFEHIFNFIMLAELLFAYDCISWFIFSFYIQELNCWCVVSCDC